MTRSSCIHNPIISFKKKFQLCFRLKSLQTVLEERSIWRTNCESDLFLLLKNLHDAEKNRKLDRKRPNNLPRLHNLSSVDVCTNITSISSIIIFLADWTLKRWLSWDTTVIVITDWNLRAKATSACLWLNHYSRVNIKSYLGGGSVASPFPEKVDLLEVVVIFPQTSKLQPERREIKLDIRKLRVLSLFFFFYVGCNLLSYH